MSYFDDNEDFIIYGSRRRHRRCNPNHHNHKEHHNMEILLPTGRLVSGSVSKLFAQTEADGKTPKLGKDGKQHMSVSFGVAIPKTQADWRNEPWGQQIFEIGKSAQPLLHQNPAFAWKVDDGDNKIPNKKGKINAERTGFPGNWIIWFSQGWAPRLVNADGTVEVPPEAIVTGYYVQVYVSANYNNADTSKGHTPGIYMNPVAVSLQGVGEKIVSDVDTTALGFGGALPAGAQPIPPVVEGAAFGTPAPAAPAPQTPVKPNDAFMTPPPPVTPPPAAPSGPVMTPKAGGATYESFRAAHWTDAQLREHGYML